MTYDKDKLDQQNREVLENNIEQSKKLIAERQRQEDEGDPTEGRDRFGQVPRPGKESPQHDGKPVAPGTDNVPAGGISSMGTDWAGRRAHKEH